MSENARKLKELLPIWAEFTGVIISLICKVLAERAIPNPNQAGEE